MQPKALKNVEYFLELLDFSRLTSALNYPVVAGNQLPSLPITYLRSWPAFRGCLMLDRFGPISLNGTIMPDYGNFPHIYSCVHTFPARLADIF